MKIAITCGSGNLDAPIDQRFGRAPGFLIYDLESDQYTFCDNAQNLQAPQGAGIQSARTVVNAGAEAVITGNVGPKAHSALTAGGIAIYTGANGSVSDGIQAFRAGTLVKSEEATVEGHW
jgi:predicted Fe-Mo cluster-binding NifX family protein